MGIRTLKRLDQQPTPGQVQVDIEGWLLSLDFDGTHLHHCQSCQRPDGHDQFDGLQRYGTDPVSLLSTWELAQIERLLIETAPR
ncbi:hypothetical protein [Pseudomonas sp. PD9R]|uniref:DUF7693 family protein n=1 Tax=Pseudomonas sp. PD9R TaxID=2853534 RepID=UPI0035250EC2